MCNAVPGTHRGKKDDIIRQSSGLRSKFEASGSYIVRISQKKKSNNINILNINNILRF